MSETAERSRNAVSALSPMGFVGLGRMGGPMAGHLVAAGFDVVPYDQDASALERFCSETDAKPAANLEDLATRSKLVITMLPTSAIVREVVVGDSGLIRHLVPGTIIVDMGTSDPSETRKLGKQLSECGFALIDAPVAGGVVFAEDATLDIAAGGDRELVEKLRPLFDAMGRSLTYCGELGSAHAIKALNNYVNAAVLGVYMEALVMARAFGLDLELATRSMEAATLDRNHPYLKKIVPQVFSRQFNSKMALGLIAKDVGIAESMAKSLEHEAPLVAATADLWRRAADEIGATRDQTELVKFWEKRFAVELEMRREEG